MINITPRTFNPDGSVPFNSIIDIVITGGYANVPVTMFMNPPGMQTYTPLGNTDSNGNYSTTMLAGIDPTYSGLITYTVQSGGTQSYTFNIVAANAIEPNTTNSVAATVPVAVVPTVPQVVTNTTNTTVNSIPIQPNAQTAASATAAVSNSTDLIVGGIDFSTNYLDVPLWGWVIGGAVVLFMISGNGKKGRF